MSAIVDIPEKWAFGKEDIEMLLSQFSGFDVFYVNLDDLTDRKAAVEQITTLIKIETLQYNNVDTDFIKAQEYILSPFNDSSSLVDSGSHIIAEQDDMSNMEIQDRGSSNLTEEA